MTNITMDWEFLENGRSIFPISVGLVSETGEKLYRVNYGVKDMWGTLESHDFLRDHVLPHLPQADYSYTAFPENTSVIQRKLDVANYDVSSLATMRTEIQEFITSFPDPQLWAWYAAYDHVTLAQLWGPMVDMPREIPWFTHDIKTLEWLAAKKLLEDKTIKSDDELDYVIHQLERDKPKQDPATEHHALHDAEHDMDLIRYFMRFI